MSEFLKWSKQEHAAHPRTYSRYAVSSVALLRYFGDAPLDKINPEMLCVSKQQLEQFNAAQQIAAFVKQQTTMTQ